MFVTRSSATAPCQAHVRVSVLRPEGEPQRPPNAPCIALDEKQSTPKRAPRTSDIGTDLAAPLEPSARKSGRLRDRRFIAEAVATSLGTLGCSWALGIPGATRIPFGLSTARFRARRVRERPPPGPSRNDRASLRRRSPDVVTPGTAWRSGDMWSKGSFAWCRRRDFQARAKSVRLVA